MRFVRWRWLILAVLVLAGVSCNGDDREFPDERDVPQEAFMVMPGATVIESEFTEGYRISDIDGRNRDFSSILSIDYQVDGATGRDVYDWYLAELSSRGWQFRTTGTLETGGDPDQCTGDSGYCGSFHPSDIAAPGESRIVSLELYLYHWSEDMASPVGVANIDAQIDGFRIRSLVDFAASR